MSTEYTQHKRKTMQELYNLSKNLIELRKQFGMTQQEVAAKLNITYQAYQAYEHGVSVPTLQNFIKLAKLFDISCDELLGIE